MVDQWMETKMKTNATPADETNQAHQFVQRRLDQILQCARNIQSWPSAVQALHELFQLCALVDAGHVTEAMNAETLFLRNPGLLQADAAALE